MSSAGTVLPHSYSVAYYLLAPAAIDSAPVFPPRQQSEEAAEVICPLYRFKGGSGGKVRTCGMEVGNDFKTYDPVI